MSKKTKKAECANLVQDGIKAADANRHDEAIKMFTAAMKLDRKSAAPYLHRGVSYDRKFLYDKAISDFSTVIAIEPKNELAYFNRALSFSRKGDHSICIADYTRAIELAPQSDLYRFSRGNAYCRLEKFNEALADYDEAIEIGPESFIHYVNRARAYQALHRDQDCVDDIERAFERGIGDITEHTDFKLLAMVYDTRGRSLIELVRLEEALADFTEAIRLDPKNSSFFSGRAMVHNNMRHYELSIADASTAIVLDPQCAQAFQARSVARRNSNLLDDALKDINVAIALALDDDQPTDWMERERDKVLYYLEQRASGVEFKPLPEAPAAGVDPLIAGTPVEGVLGELMKRIEGEERARSQNPAAPPALSAQYVANLDTIATKVLAYYTSLQPGDFFPDSLRPGNSGVLAVEMMKRIEDERAQILSPSAPQVTSAELEAGLNAIANLLVAEHHSRQNRKQAEDIEALSGALARAKKTLAALPASVTNPLDEKTVGAELGAVVQLLVLIPRENRAARLAELNALDPTLNAEIVDVPRPADGTAQAVLPLADDLAANLDQQTSSQMVRLTIGRVTYELDVDFVDTAPKSGEVAEGTIIVPALAAEPAPAKPRIGHIIFGKEFHDLVTGTLRGAANAVRGGQPEGPTAGLSQAPSPLPSNVTEHADCERRTPDPAARANVWVELERNTQIFKTCTMCAAPRCYSENPREAGAKAMFRCAQCRQNIYCSHECQKNHWREGHRQECLALPRPFTGPSVKPATSDPGSNPVCPLAQLMTAPVYKTTLFKNKPYDESG